jgi:hypothetical protein
MGGELEAIPIAVSGGGAATALISVTVPVAHTTMAWRDSGPLVAEASLG